MRTAIVLLLAAAPAASAGFSPEALLEPNWENWARRRLEEVQGIRYRVDGLGRPMPRPPGLADVRVAELESIFESSAPGLKPAQKREILNRLGGGLRAIDEAFRRPIPDAEWSLVLGRARESFRARAAGIAQPHELQAAVDDVLRDVVGRLGDPYAYFSGGREMAEMHHEAGGKNVGVGVSLDDHPRGALIRGVVPGSPAERQGVRKGDVLAAIDGEGLAGLKLGEVRARLRRDVGAPLVLQLLREDAALTVSVAREVYPGPGVVSDMAAPGVGYVHFGQFARKTDERVFAAIEALLKQGARALILDLRGNPGGSMGVTRSIASEFLSRDQVIDSLDKRGTPVERAVTEESRWPRLPLVLLVDGGSASASEVLAAALKEHKRALIVGSRTYGKDVYQESAPTLVPNPHHDPDWDGDETNPNFPVYADGTAAVLTQGGWYTPSGATVAGGLEPDVAVPMSSVESELVSAALARRLYGRPAAFRDRALDKALEILSSPQP